jgi:hypothetical protein
VPGKQPEEERPEWGAEFSIRLRHLEPGAELDAHPTAAQATAVGLRQVLTLPSCLSSPKNLKHSRRMWWITLLADEGGPYGDYSPG